MPVGGLSRGCWRGWRSVSEQRNHGWRQGKSHFIMTRAPARTFRPVSRAPLSIPRRRVERSRRGRAVVIRLCDVRCLGINVVVLTR